MRSSVEQNAEPRITRAVLRVAAGRARRRPGRGRQGRRRAAGADRPDDLDHARHRAGHVRAGLARGRRDRDHDRGAPGHPQPAGRAAAALRSRAPVRRRRRRCRGRQRPHEDGRHLPRAVDDRPHARPAADRGRRARGRRPAADRRRAVGRQHRRRRGGHRCGRLRVLRPEVAARPAGKRCALGQPGADAADLAGDLRVPEPGGRRDRQVQDDRRPAGRRHQRPGDGCRVHCGAGVGRGTARRPRALGRADRGTTPPPRASGWPRCPGSSSGWTAATA